MIHCVLEWNIISLSHFQISDLKRLNKIEKEIEIHARKTIKVPVNAHTILLNTAKTDELPMVHKSGQNSPKHLNNELNKENFTLNGATHIQPLPNNINGLNEKLLVASVSLVSSNNLNEPNCSTSNQFSTNDRIQINDLIMKSDILTRQQYQKDHRIQDDNDEESVFTDPLLSSDIDEYSTLRSGPHVIRGTPRNKYTFSGSDCDIPWICLLIFILALCFAIPLIYVIYIAEHPDKFSQEDKPHLSASGSSSSIVSASSHSAH